MIAFAEGTVLHIQHIQLEQSKRAINSDKVQWTLFYRPRETVRWSPVHWHAGVWVEELYCDPPRLIILHRCSGSSFPRMYCGSASRPTQSLMSACTVFFFSSWRVKADHPLRVRVRSASCGGACKMLSRGISLHTSTFYLQTLHPFSCRSADASFRKSKRLVLFRKVLNRVIFLWHLMVSWFFLVHTTAFINTN